MSTPLDHLDHDRFIPSDMVDDPYDGYGSYAQAEAAQATTGRGSDTPSEVIVVEDANQTEEERVRHALAAVTAKGLDGMSRADRIAALTAVASAIDEQIKADKSFLTDQFAGATKNQTIVTTLGKLTYIPESRKAIPDEAKLLAYVKENYPEAVTTRTVEEIAPDVRAEILGSVIDSGDGDFVDGATGQVVHFMTLGKPSSPSITYPASREQKIVKREAKRALSDQLTALTSGMLDAAAGKPGISS